MNRRALYAAAAGMLPLPSVSWADFKYAENAEFTGGAKAGLMKFAAGGKGSGADSSAYSIKGNRMRVESDKEIFNSRETVRKSSGCGQVRQITQGDRT